MNSNKIKTISLKIFAINNEVYHSISGMGADGPEPLPHLRLIS